MNTIQIGLVILRPSAHTLPRLAWIVPIALVLTRHLTGSDPPVDPVTPAELAEDKPKIEPEAAAEILRYRIEIDDSREWDRNITTQTRFKIYDPARAVGVTRLALFRSDRENDNHQIMARLTLPDGTSRIFDKHDLRERNVAEGGRANGILGRLHAISSWGIEERFLAVTGVVKGAVLDVWEWEPNLAKTVWHMNTIQRPDTPIRQFEYLGRYRPDKEILHRGFVLNPCGGQMTHDEKAGIIRFTAQNLPSIRREPFAPPDTYFSLTIIETDDSLYRGLNRKNLRVPLPASVPLSLGPWAFFSTAQDFQDADKGYITKRVKAKSADLVAGAADPREKARRIYDYVRTLYQRYRNRVNLGGSPDWVKSADELVDLEKNDEVFRTRRRLFLPICRARTFRRTGMPQRISSAANRVSVPG